MSRPQTDLPTLENARLPSLRDKHLAQLSNASEAPAKEKGRKKLKAKKK